MPDEVAKNLKDITEALERLKLRNQICQEQEFLNRLLGRTKRRGGRFEPRPVRL